MKKKSSIITVIILFTILNITAQTNFRKGFVVTNNNDTISGFIDYKYWIYNPKSISFKKVNSEKVIKYLPSDIKSFFVEKEYYKGGFVEIGRNYEDFGKIDNQRFLDYKKEALFLKYLVKGKLNLLSLKEIGSDRVHFFVQTENQKVQQLVKKKYLTEKDGEKISTFNNLYVGTLKLEMHDAPELFERITNTSLSYGSLTRLISDYNKEHGTNSYKYINKSRAWKSSLELIIGAVNQTFNELSENNDFTNELRYSFIGGIGFNTFNPRKLKSLSLYTSVKLKKVKYNYNYQEQNLSFPTFYDIYYKNIDALCLQTNIVLRYNYRYKNFNFFIDGGGAIINGIFDNSNLLIEHHSGQIVDTEKQPVAYYNYTYDFGLGIYFKRLNLELRHQKESYNLSFGYVFYKN